MAKEPVWTRAYLKSIGAQDNEIDYQNGAVTYKNKPFQYTQPGADGKAYGSQQELDSAYKSYQNNDAMEQFKASSANRMGEANTALGQYKQNISKAPTPFTYDANSIKSDPLYTSGLQSLQNDAQTATNQSLVNLGRRGIGNSQSAVTSANAQQQNVVNQANTKLAPQVIAQRYQAYMDANAQQDKQNQSLLGYANSLGTLGQNEFNNARLLGSDQRLANQDEITNQRNSVLDANLAEDRGYANQDRNIKRAADLQKDYGVPIKPTEDYSQALAQVEGLKTVAQQKQEADGQKAAYDNAWKQFETIGRVTAELAPILGLPVGTTTQQASYQNATLKNAQDNTTFDNTLARNKFDKEYDPNTLDNQSKAQQIAKAKAELEQLGKTKPITVQDAQNILLKTPFVSEETTTDALGNVIKTGKTKIDKPGLVQAIAGLGMSDEQMDSLFLLNGISDKEVQEISAQLRASRGN